MNQIELFEIKNPCIGVCENNPRGFCRGCFRSREERQHWNVLEANVKYQIIKACAQRKKRMQVTKVVATDLNSSSQSDLF